MKSLVLAAFAIACLVAGAGRALAVTELQFWFGVSGASADVIQALAKEFNSSQPDYRVVPIFKGTYPETLRAGIEAFEAGHPPHIIQIFDVGTGVMMNNERRLHPGRRRLGDSRRDFRQGAVSSGNRRLLFASRRDDGVISRSIPPRRSSSTTRTYTARRPRCGRSSQDLARRVVGGPPDRSSGRSDLRLYVGVAHLDPPRELRRLEQPPLRQQ